MATLELIWDRVQSFSLRSPTKASGHTTVQMIRRIRNRVYLARMGCPSMASSQLIAVKIGWSTELVALEKEIEFYENQLRNLQGTVVPRMLGYYRGIIDRRDAGFMLMEYCSGPTMIDSVELNRLVMLSCCRLHEAGIFHGDLLDGRHFVGMGRGVRIVDFSTAVTHVCRRGTPLLIQDTINPGPRRKGCGELSDLELAYGAFSGHSRLR